MRDAYARFTDEVHQQAEALKASGIHPEYVNEDPYKTSADMMRDLRERGRIRVFKTQADQGHPLLTPEQNDEFRFVHDVIGHAGGGHNFTARGEENAFRAHLGTFSPEAQRAMATETRGQNSYFNFSERNRDLPNAQRAFAEQKAALFPQEFMGEYGTFPAPEAPALHLPTEGKGLLDYLSDAERSRILKNKVLRRSFDRAAELLGPDAPLIAASLHGQLARGGYEGTAQTLRQVFGQDAPTFAKLWSAVSPQQPNETAIHMALEGWADWVRAGRPTDPGELERTLRPAISGLWNSRGPNAMRALRGEELSGPKVAPFGESLMGYLKDPVLDVIQAQGMGVNPQKWDVLGTNYAGRGQVRRVADALEPITGAPWEPGHAQETGWSTIRAISQEGGLEGVTPEVAGQQWGPSLVGDLFNQEPYAGTLARAGLAPPPISEQVPSLLFPTGIPDDLRKLAEQIAASGRGQYRLGAGLLPLGLLPRQQQ